MTFRLRSAVLSICLLLVLMAADSGVQGNGYMQIEFQTYSNPDGRCQDGTFCDPFGVTDVGDKCDPQFRLTADQSVPGGNGIFDYQQTSVYWDTQPVNFGSRFGDIPNPVAIAMNYKNPGFLPITVSAVDKDTIPPDDPMDTFSASLVARADSEQRSLEMTSQSNPSNAKHTLSIRYRFICYSSYYGLDCNTFCEAHNDDANGHYSCDSSGSKVCLAGWTGADCNRRTPCFINPCENGGTCSDVGGAAKCDCPPNFTGSRCETDVNECETGAQPCLNGGSCKNSFGGFSCSCSTGFAGARCDSDVNECESVPPPCLNNGTCRNRFGSFNCSCPRGFSGALCESDVDECESDPPPCLNNGTCENSFGSFNCSCPEGLTGALCELDVNECTSEMTPCSNGSTCVNSFGTFTCQCRPGLTGRLCDEDIDECLGSPCSIGATCVNIEGGFTCQCPPGLTGTLCDQDVNECLAPGACLNGATCVNTLGNFSCACPSGLTGRRCEQDVDECVESQSACRNGGSCNNTFGNYSCLCPKEFTGRRCEQDVDECAVVPSLCLHNGTCENRLGGFSCRCQPEFNGSRCQEHVCDGIKCANNGACEASLEEVGVAACFCRKGFSGKFCEINVEPEALKSVIYEPYGSVIIGASVAGSAVLVVVVIIVAAVCIHRKRKAKSCSTTSEGVLTEIDPANCKSKDVNTDNVNETVDGNKYDEAEANNSKKKDTIDSCSTTCEDVYLKSDLAYVNSEAITTDRVKETDARPEEDNEYAEAEDDKQTQQQLDEVGCVQQS